MTDAPVTAPDLVFKILPRAVWLAAQAAGAWPGSADDLRDGFIHFSTREQVPGTLGRHFAGQRDLVLVGFRAGDLGPALKWEPSRRGALFPHLYAVLDPGLAISVEPLP
ncbi:DUF952 domain-containing protein [Zavarzinia sp. CC-PAN008]|uniref:DUF952 domain-containing protein n=1 Tax=Zavarzinia sp. CC-PAN008 TaxID=3243332 RepID=UPI003F74551D